MQEFPIYYTIQRALQANKLHSGQKHYRSSISTNSYSTATRQQHNHPPNLNYRRRVTCIMYDSFARFLTGRLLNATMAATQLPVNHIDILLLLFFPIYWITKLQPLCMCAREMLDLTTMARERNLNSHCSYNNNTHIMLRKHRLHHHNKKKYHAKKKRPCDSVQKFYSLVCWSRYVAFRFLRLKQKSVGIYEYVAQKGATEKTTKKALRHCQLNKYSKLL